MRRYRITTPEPGWEGKVGTVNFVGGKAECEADADTAALYYFWAQGYGIHPLDDGPDYTPPGNRTIDDEIAETQARLAALKARAAGQDTAAGEQPAEPGDDAAADKMPRRNASEATWRDYAVAHGMSRDEADTLSRDELVARYTKEG